ncbi:MAG TPA: hypothetical protein P5136_00315 [Methanofastidiosum sp.]|nr:hypothetical protein [Methanofastidiosum sp.]
MSDKIVTSGNFKYQLFNEFNKKDKDKIAELVELNHKEFYISPTVEGFIYATTRALDFGDYHGTLDKKALWEHAVNKNSDLFNYDEITAEHPTRKVSRYLTFRRAGIFLNHNSSNPEGAIGLAFDATLITEPYEDMHVVLLFGIDKYKSPGIARTLQTYPTRIGTSMGCSIKSSQCTVCGKEIYKDSDFCKCLKHNRGGRVKGIRVAELLRDMEFYEQSIVTSPACDTAYVIDAVSEIIPGRLLKVAKESSDAQKIEQIMATIYSQMKQATSFQDKKRLSNQLDSLIGKLEKMF